MQKFLGLNTYVPPHPPDDLDLWGSNPKLGVALGNDENGICTKEDSILRFNKALKYYTNKGFRLCLEENKSLKKEVIIGNGLSSFIFLKRLLRKYKWLHNFSIKLNNKLKKAGIHF